MLWGHRKSGPWATVYQSLPCSTPFGIVFYCCYCHITNFLQTSLIIKIKYGSWYLQAKDLRVFGWVTHQVQPGCWLWLQSLKDLLLTVDWPKGERQKCQCHLLSFPSYNHLTGYTDQPLHHLGQSIKVINTRVGSSFVLATITQYDYTMFAYEYWVVSSFQFLLSSMSLACIHIHLYGLPLMISVTVLGYFFLILIWV